MINEEIDYYKAVFYQNPELYYEPNDWLWADDWYDGPLSGIMKRKDKLCWYEWFDNAPFQIQGIRPEILSRPRVFGVRELSREQAQEEIQRRYYFRKVYKQASGYAAWDLNCDDETMEKLMEEFDVPYRRDISDECDYETIYPAKEDENFDTYGYRNKANIIGWTIEYDGIERLPLTEED